jgi:hypothetical protein
LSFAGKGSSPLGADGSELPPAAFAPGLDLLRERRRQIGQEPITVALADRRRLLVQGTVLGSIVFGLVLGLTGLVLLRHQLVKAQMGQLQAVEAQAQLRARTALAMHFGTFQLTREAMDEPAQRLLAARGAQDFRVPGFGESLVLEI